MSYTREEWAWIKERLVPGVTGIFDTYGNKYKFEMKSNTVATFLHAGGNRHWDITPYNSLTCASWEVTEFFWPDGMPIIPFVERDGTKWDAVLWKVKQLDMKFKNKTLPKVKGQALPLP